MLYCHYEEFNMRQDPNLKYLKLLFNSGPSSYSSLRTADFKRVKDIIEIFKQIPSSKRSHDPATKIWIVPNTEEIRNMISSLVDHILEHPSLDLWFNPPPPQAQDKESAQRWAQDLFDSGRAKVQAPEEFFNSYAVTTQTLPLNELAVRIAKLIKPFVNFELNQNDRESMLRAYKLASRRLHPDVKGGSAQLMSELNSLWMQYKELI